MTAGGPTGAADPARGPLAARFTALLELCGVGQDRLAAKAGVKPTTLSGWKRGRRPRTEAELLAVVQVALADIQARCRTGALTLTDEQRELLRLGRWREWYRQARAAGGDEELSVAPPCRWWPTVATADPVQLGVHQALPSDVVSPLAAPAALPAYLARPHDGQLRDLLGRAARGEPGPRLVVLTGESTVGKTRALWEAIHTVLPTWRLWAPADDTELIETLGSPALQAAPSSAPAGGIVLWLNELQRHLDGARSAEAARLLHRALADPGDRPPLVAVGALWERPYWAQLTAQGQVPDSHAAARELLTGPCACRLAVPTTLDDDQQRHLTASSDPRLRQAAAAGATDGQVIQHLTGGPELLAAYRSGTFFTPVETALIDAAVDARRLGHRQPIPAAFLRAAADGALAPHQRSDDSGALEAALAALVSGVRPDGTRTDIRHTLTALTPWRQASGGPTCYEPHDYLSQHLGRARATVVPGSEFWAAAAHTEPEACTALATAAHNRGLYRHAAWLHKHAARHGHADAARSLLHHQPDNADFTERAARWAAAHTDLTDPQAVGFLLGDLHGLWRSPQPGTEEPMAMLLARAPAADSELTDPRAVATLLRLLHQVGAMDQVAALLARNPVAHTDPSDPQAVGDLLLVLHEVNAADQVTALIQRARASATPANPYALAALLDVLCQAKDRGHRWAQAQMGALLAEDPAARVALTDPHEVLYLLLVLHRAGAADQVTTLAQRLIVRATSTAPLVVDQLLRTLHQVEAIKQVPTLARHAVLNTDPADALAVANTAQTLNKVGAIEEARVLLAHASVTQVDLTDPWAVARLLGVLHELGAHDQVQALLDRDPAAQIDLTPSWAVARLLGVLHELGIHDQVQALLDRDPAAQTHFVAASEARRLVRVLSWLNAQDQVATVIERVARCIDLTDRREVAKLLDTLRTAGADEQAARLLEQLPALGLFTRYLGETGQHARFRYGREPNGAPAAPWGWDDLD
ncbi:helix-turn-helix domain-containing protein [Actinomadura kijaniata]|uniref:helix-turn-helix domain-containing protein n=1 Tax=Actinomadura kijaniata TaxID=46161 RepID=UPI000830F618|nr:helix-turn-helix transcriptional regulator [Actinomadura kijaniata]